MEDLKETNALLYHTALELDRYQDMTQEVLNYIENKKKGVILWIEILL